MKLRYTISIVCIMALSAYGLYGLRHKEGPAKPLTHNDIAGEPYLKVKAGKLKSTIVTAHLEQKIEPGKNILWCSTFQYAWNELCDLSGGPIDMRSAPPIVAILNKRSASKNDLDAASYVAMAGLASDGIYDRIRRELLQKFRDQASPDLLNSIPETGWVAYAYLWKVMPFEWAFTRSKYGLEFDGEPVDNFGVNQYLKDQDNEVKMIRQVDILDYRNEDDFIVELKTRAGADRLIVAKVPPAQTLGSAVSSVLSRITGAKASKIGDMESLSVPVLDFDIRREYSELYNHPMKARNPKMNGRSIAIALQSIRFRLDEKGAVLKSEAIMAPGISRNYYFDKPFLVLLKRKDAENPYFALWVANRELMQPGVRR